MKTFIIRGVNQPWRLGKFYGDSKFAFKDNGHGYVNELEGLAQQPCQKADLSISEQLSHQLYSNNKVRADTDYWHHYNYPALDCAWGRSRPREHQHTARPRPRNPLIQLLQDQVWPGPTEG